METTYVMVKDVKMLKKMILTSRRGVKHLFSGQNTQQMGVKPILSVSFAQTRKIYKLKIAEI